MPQNPDHSDRELLVKLQQGDHRAFKEIFKRYDEKLLFYVIAIVKIEEIGKDIVQESFIRLWVNREKVDPEQSLSGYLHTIARNLSLNQLKRVGYDQELKQLVWKRIQEAQQHILIEEDIFANESKQLIHQAIERLPPQRKKIFQLSRNVGMSHKDIAIKLGISKNTVKNQIVTALKEIRVFIQNNINIALCWMIIDLAFIIC